MMEYSTMNYKENICILHASYNKLEKVNDGGKICASRSRNHWGKMVALYKSPSKLAL
jgi:hypothetical protein